MIIFVVLQQLPRCNTKQSKNQTKSTTSASAKIVRFNTFLFFAELRERASIKASSI